MRATKDQLLRTQSDMSRMCAEEVRVEQIGSIIYAFGSELATLRLFAKYRANGGVDSPGTRCGYSDNLGSFYFSIDV